MVSGTADCLSSGGRDNNMLNPMDPQNRRWFTSYLKALLRVFGDVIDGFVWDETFYITPKHNEMAGGCLLHSLLCVSNPSVVFALERQNLPCEQVRCAGDAELD